jgi:hypothetical protein
MGQLTTRDTFAQWQAPWLLRGATYEWWVEAQLPDGRTLVSDTLRFFVTP